MARTADPFDIDVFLAQPLLARVAAAGPSVRAIWFLWEQGCFWWLTGSWARLPAILTEDPRVALVVDTCDLSSGAVRQVSASGVAELLPFDPDRARRKLVRYLGADEHARDPRFQIEALALDETTRFVRLSPLRLIARDLSFRPAVTTASPGLALTGGRAGFMRQPHAEGAPRHTVAKSRCQA